MKVTKQKIDRLADRAAVSEETAKDALERADGDLLEAVLLLEQEGKLGSAKPENGTSWSTSSGVPAVITLPADVKDQAPGGGEAGSFGFDSNDPAGDPVMGGGGGGSAGTESGAAYTQAADGQNLGQGAAAQSAPKEDDFVGGPPPYGNYGYAYWSDGDEASAGGPQGSKGENSRKQQYYYDKKTRSYSYRDESTDFEEGAMRFGRALLRILRGSVVNLFEVWYKGELLFHFPVILFLLLFVPAIFWLTLVTLTIGLACGWRYKFSGPHLGRRDGDG